MTENKNLLEELRENKRESLTWALADIFGLDYFDRTRYVCASEILCAIADRIEREFVPISQLCSDRFYESRGFQWPRFEDGTPVKFGDEFVSDTGEKTYLTSLGLSCGGYAMLNYGAERNEECLLVLDGDRVERHLSDAQKSINADATNSPRDYCEEVLGWDPVDIETSDDEDLLAAMVDDLLRRQRKAMEQR